MFIDASALTALLTKEQEARELLARMQQGPDSSDLIFGFLGGDD